MSNLGNKEILSKNVKRLMQELDVNATQLAKDIKVPYTTVVSWINADNYPRIDKIEIMANYFGVSKAMLVEEFKPSPMNTKEARRATSAISKLNRDGQGQVADFAEVLVKSNQFNINSEKNVKLFDEQRTYEAAADNGEVTDRDLNTAFEAIKKREDDDKKRTNNDWIRKY